MQYTCYISLFLLRKKKLCLVSGVSPFEIITWIPYKQCYGFKWFTLIWIKWVYTLKIFAWALNHLVKKNPEALKHSSHDFPKLLILVTTAYNPVTMCNRHQNKYSYTFSECYALIVRCYWAHANKCASSQCACEHVLNTLLFY